MYGSWRYGVRYLWLCHSRDACIQSVQNIRTTFLILGCVSCCPQNSFNSSGHGLYKVLNAFYRDASPCWLQCFPQLCQVGWMSCGWWTILDTYGKLLSVKNPAALQFLTHSNRCTWHLLPYPVQRHLNILSCPFTLWMAHTHTHTIYVSIVSRLKSPSLTCLLPFTYTNWSQFNTWHQ